MIKFHPYLKNDRSSYDKSKKWLDIKIVSNEIVKYEKQLAKILRIIWDMELVKQKYGLRLSILLIYEIYFNEIMSFSKYK